VAEVCVVIEIMVGGEAANFAFLSVSVYKIDGEVASIDWRLMPRLSM
jgi:hypothetical protein